MKRKLAGLVISLMMGSSMFAQSNMQSVTIEKAAKDFAVRFKDAKDITWSNGRSGVLAWFNMDGARNRAGYDKRGNWLYNLKYYGEGQLQQDVRSVLKSVYYDYNIIAVTEVETGEGTAFLVHITDDKFCKTIRVCNETMDVLEDIKKTTDGLAQ